MPLRPEDIDPTIQTLLKERMALIFQQQAPPTDPVSVRVRSAGTAAWKATAAKHKAYFWGAGLSWLAGVFALPAMESGQGEGVAVLAFLGLSALAVSLVVTGFKKTNRELTQYANADVLRYAGAQLALSRAETAYCEAVAALIDAGSVLSDEVQRDVVAQLNGLLQNYRRLENPVRQAQAAMATQSIGALEQELAGLMSRRDAQTDSVARATMDQSVELCRRRLEASRAMEPARQQAEAQQELILQTMASVQASLGRTTGVNIKTPDLNLGELQQSVAQVSTHTRAVEEAVAEVVALSG